MRTGLLKGQLLVYPVLSQREPDLPGYRFSLSDYQICEEHRRWAQAEILSLKQTMDAFRLYTRTDREDLSPDASPLLDKNFAGLPPTWLFCAEFDSLTRQARAYAARLAAAGVPVCLTVYRGMAHGFMNRLGRYPQAELLHRDMAQALQQFCVHGGPFWFLRLARTPLSVTAYGRASSPAGGAKCTCVNYGKLHCKAKL